jgi:hypothetical protein
MKRVITLTESDIKDIITRVLLEQENLNPKNLKFGSGGRANPNQVDDVKQLQQKLMDMGYLKTKSMVPTGYFGTLTNAALQNAMGKSPAAPTVPAKQATAPTKQVATQTQPAKPDSGYQKPAKTAKEQYCQTITPQSDIVDLPNIIKSWQLSYPDVEPYGLVNRMLNKYAQAYIDQLGVNAKEIACQMALIQMRPGYKDKNAIISDTKNHQIYIFDSKGKFLAKDFIISGKNKQSTEARKIANALLSWSDGAKKLGFEWQQGKGYVDVTGKNRKYDEEIIYSNIDKNKTRFLPKGIFTTVPEMSSASGYAGDKDNLLNIMQDGKILAQAIHGYYLEQPRKRVMDLARKVATSPDDPKVNDEFIKLLSSGKVNFSQSYGCLNVSDRFLPKLQEFGKNSYLFNIGEDRNNYLVKNGDNYLNKTIGVQACPSPNSLGAEAVV